MNAASFREELTKNTPNVPQNPPQHVLHHEVNFRVQHLVAVHELRRVAPQLRSSEIDEMRVYGGNFMTTLKLPEIFLPSFNKTTA